MNHELRRDGTVKRRSRPGGFTRNPMLRKLRAILTLLVLAGTAAFALHFSRRAAPAASAPPGYWVVSDGETVKGDAAPRPNSAVWDGTTIKLFGLRNEVVAWQLALRPQADITGGKITFEPFTGEGGATIPADAVKIFRLHYLTVTVPSQYEQDKPATAVMGPGEYPVQALPLGDGGFEVAQGKTRAIWFDLHLPPGAKPGLYKSKLVAKGANLDLGYPVELQIYPATMPRETHLRNWFYYGPEQLREHYGGDDLAAVEDAFITLAHDHRATLLSDIGLNDGQFDWAGWWARYGGYVSGQAFTAGPCHGAGASLIPTRIVADEQAAYQAAAKSIVGYLGGRKLLDRTFLYVWDEPGSADAYAQVRQRGQWVDQAVGDKLKVMVTEQLEPEKPEFGSLAGAVDIFCSGKTSDAGLAKLRTDDALWVYNEGLAGAPLIDTPRLGLVAWGPAAWRYGVTGWYLWDATYWRQKHYDVKTPTDLYNDPLTFDETLKRVDGKPYPAQYALRLNGDGVMLYPGDPVGVSGAVAGTRLKAFRRGAQDYEYLWLLAQQGRRGQADAFAARLSTGRNRWLTDADAWVKVRREMAAAL